MAYNYATFSDAKQQLGLRLYDTGSLFWTDEEKGLYVIESLRAWNAYSNFFRGEFLFNTAASTTYYDLTDTANLPNTLRPLTVTDVDLYVVIQHHLLEPATGAVWSGSLQFSMDDIVAATQRRMDELLSTTGCYVNRSVVLAQPGRTQLGDDVIDIRRIAWLPVTSPAHYTNIPLSADDTYALESFVPLYTTNPPGSPSTYRQSTEPPLTFDVDTDPAVNGQYELLTVNAGPTITSLTPSYLYVPDDFAWIIKWGVLADLLSRESNAKDLPRAQYCEARYKQGLELLRLAPAILYARIDNLPMPIDAITNADTYNPNWQAATAAEPTLLLIAGLNLIAFSPSPNTSYPITLAVVRNAPIPTADLDFIQLSRDDYDAVLDYAQHLASFKMGGAEFDSTLPLFQRFLTRAMLYNSKLAELGEYTDVIFSRSSTENETNPVYNRNDVLSSKE